MIKSLSGFDCFPLEMVGVVGKYKTRTKTMKMIEINFSSPMVLKGPFIVTFMELLQLTLFVLSGNLVSRFCCSW
jgi:hypothetical protein